MRIATIVGNRPQFVKAAPVSRALRSEHEEVLIHTGQHHDAELSAVFFEELAIPAPDYHLGIAGDTNTSQLARMLPALESLLASVAPDRVLVYGDTNSTLAAALTAADGGVALIHVEAGMRSGDRSQPEERNRVLTDQLSSLLLCSTPSAMEHLVAEGVPGRAVLVGDVMADVAIATRERAMGRVELLAAHGVRSGEYLLVTAHRAGNVDEPDQLERLVALLETLPGPVLMALHPRTRARLTQFGLMRRAQAAVTITPPLGYLDFATLLHHARAVLTDSGGVQKEAYIAGVRCLTLRERTEWTETVTSGWNTLVGLDGDLAITALRGPAPTTRPALYGDGAAAARIVAAIG